MIRRLLTMTACAVAVSQAAAGCSLPGSGRAPEPAVTTVTVVSTSREHTPPAAATHHTVTPTTAPRQTASGRHDRGTGGSTGPAVVPDGGTTGHRSTLRQVYRSILDDPMLLPYSGPMTGLFRRTGRDRYTLADLDNDGRPEMLLDVGLEDTDTGHTAVGYVTVVLGTSTPGAVVVADGVTRDGRSDFGGDSWSTLIPTAGNTGMAELLFDPDTAGFVVNTYHLARGTVLTKTDEFIPRGGIALQELPETPGYCIPFWRPLDDDSLLDEMTPGRCLTGRGRS